MENPSNLGTSQNQPLDSNSEPPKRISAETKHMIENLVALYAVFFPKNNKPAQNTDEEIDRAANEYF